MEEATELVHIVKGVAAPVVIREQRSRGLSFQVWPAASALCSFLEEKQTEWMVPGASVLELGSGPGLVGLVAARLGAARVLLTDLPQAIPNLAYNAQRNFPGDGGAVIEARTLRWGVEEDVAQLAQDWSFDLIVASDVVYYDYLFQPLLQTLKWLLSSSPPQERPPKVLLAHIRRWTKDTKFFKMARKSFQVEVVATYPPPPGNKKPVVIYSLAAR
ncbi:protein-lysine methyltransferase METTL21C [Selaginella moellendorffii]|nr:protein-lysine methyltransferase METTL21C [Selaginella moellendorffii]|eukprot:XP_002961392.2 protein-lysine methyltransferase METTL21C [Selaginella moellendorffii]